MQSIDLNVSLPPGAKEKLADGSLRIIGAVVQDTAKGRIVANLKTVMKEENTDYTPALFVAIQNEICLSQALILTRVSDEFRRLKAALNEGLDRIEGKIDFLTDLEMGKLVGEINHFFSQFSNLKAEDNRRAEMMLHDGGRLAAQLAGMTDVLIRDYLGDVRLTVSGQNMTYREYLALPSDNFYRFWGDVTELTYPDLLKSRAKQFIPALIEIMNRLNIVSVCFDNELYMDYQDTLKALRSQLSHLLGQLVNGLPVRNGKFDDYAQRVFGKNKDGKWIHDNEADRLSQHFPEFSRNNLGARFFHQIIHTPGDRALVSSVREVLNMIASVDNLLMRAEELDLGAINDSESIALLRKETFPPRRNTLSLADKI